VSLRDMVVADQYIMQIYIRLHDSQKVAEFTRKALDDASALNAAFPRETALLEAARADAARLEWERAEDRGDYTAILGSKTPAPQAVRAAVALGLRRLGDLYSNEDPQSYPVYAKATAMFEQLLAEDPKNAGYKAGLADTQRAIGQNYLNDSRRGGPAGTSNLQRACENFKQSRLLFADLEAEKRVPRNLVQIPALVDTRIRNCETLLAGR
jgi:tetratricopeptide (TPR) repeat protein